VPGAIVDSLPPWRCASQCNGWIRRFEVSIPATPETATPFDVDVTSSAAAPVTLADVVVGDVWICSGQSNMELSVAATVEWQAAVSNISALGYVGCNLRPPILMPVIIVLPFGARSHLRILQVAELPAYYNVTSPQVNFTASVPWSRRLFIGSCSWYVGSLPLFQCPSRSGVPWRSHTA